MFNIICCRPFLALVNFQPIQVEAGEQLGVDGFWQLCISLLHCILQAAKAPLRSGPDIASLLSIPLGRSIVEHYPQFFPLSYRFKIHEGHGPT
jgi:hypothetical protein